jgi:hypothetical protein
MTARLVRIGGMCAIVAGLLRLAAIAVPGEQEVLWFVVDAFFLFGLIAWYLTQADRFGIAGLFGFAVAVTGILAIRSAAMFGPQGYAIGGAAFALGLIGMSLPVLVRRDGPMGPALLWIAALGFGLSPWPQAGYAAFALGFIWAGIVLLRAQAQSAQTSISTVT